MSFEKSVSFVLRRDIEGGFVDDASDHGGATNMGVTQLVYDGYRRSVGLSLQSVRSLSIDEAKTIYKDRFWTISRCDSLPEPLDLVHFDSTVQHWKVHAAKFLQRALGVPDDGVIGQQTLDALANADINQVVSSYLAHRDDFYSSIIENDATQMKFKNGWENRMNKLRKEIST